MARKLNGRLYLSKIPKELVLGDDKGRKYIYVDIVPHRNGADEYGNTHTITLYNKNTKQTIYLGNLKTQEFGAGAGTTAPGLRNPLPSTDDIDLPF